MKRKIAMFLCVVMIITTMSGIGPIAVAEASGEGYLDFSQTVLNETSNPLDKMPRTFEATIQLDAGVQVGGRILSTYDIGISASIDFDISWNGNPQLRYIYHDEYGEKIEYVFGFNNVDVRGTTPVRVTIVHDDSEMRCYVDGVLKQTRTVSNTANGNKTVSSLPTDIISPKSQVVGGDYSEGNKYYFKGKIYDVAAWADVRTVDEITTDAIGTADTDLLVAYDFSGTSGDDVYQDLSSNDNDIVVKPKFFTEKATVKDYAYSFAVIGDTQIVSEYDDANDTEYLAGIYEWILENKEDKNIEYVFGLGDITENNNAAEWQLAKDQISRLNGKIPYSIIRGNHDLTNFRTTEGDEGWNKDWFTEYLGADYKAQLVDGGFYTNDNAWNSYRTFTAGDVDYLFMMLDYGAKDDVLSWASSVIAAHPTHNVIITTHAYLFHDGSTLDASEDAPPSTLGAQYNNGDEMWAKLISKHENIVLVMCGHDPSENIIVSQDKGVNGNTVTSMLIDAQAMDQAEVDAGRVPTGTVAMLYFSEDGKNVQVEYYATSQCTDTQDTYFKQENQFAFTLPVVSENIDSCERIVKPYSKDDVIELQEKGEYPNDVEGYLFAGWYTNENCDEDRLLAGKTPTGTTYALFVPEHVLDIKAQISTNLLDSNTTNDETASIRFVTSLDSLLYKEAGFEVSYEKGGTTYRAKSASKKAYKELFVVDSTNAWGKRPEGTFCAESDYFKACILKNLSVQDFYNTEFTIIPYWITMDGDKVTGDPVKKSMKQGYEAAKLSVDIQSANNGTVVTDKDTYYWGNTVTLTVTPDADYACSSLKINGWDVASNLTANGDGTYTYSFVTMEKAYTVVPEFTRKIFKDNSKWDLTNQFNGMVSLPGGGTNTSLQFYDQYKDIDLTIIVKENATTAKAGRTDVLFEFDTNVVNNVWKNVSFGVTCTDVANKTCWVQTLGWADNHIPEKRSNGLYKLSPEEAEKYLSGEGIEFRVIRCGTSVYLYVEGKQVNVFDLTQNNSGVTADMKTKVTLRHYDAVADNVVIPFKLSSTVEEIFTTTGATGTWDLTNKYNGVVSVKNTAGLVTLPLAEKYTDIDFTLENVKEYSYVNDQSKTVYGRTDILFEFETANGTKSTSVGLIRKNENEIAVETLGNSTTIITSSAARQLRFYTLNAKEAEAYKTGDGVDLRVIRSGLYLYVYIEGQQVGVYDLAQNSSGVTADMKAKVTLRHYDVKTEKISFQFKVADKVEEAKLYINPNQNGVLTTKQISFITNKTVTTQNSTKHFVNEIVTLTATPTDSSYACTSLLVNGKEVVDNLVANANGTYAYSFKAIESNYTIIPAFERKIFKDNTKWDLSKQFEGVISLPGGGTDTSLQLYDQYKDIDLTIIAKENATTAKAGRTDVLFEFDTNVVNNIWKNVSFGVTCTNVANKECWVQTLGWADNHIPAKRINGLYQLSPEEAEKYLSGEGIEFRVVRLGTSVYLYVEGTQQAVFDLAQNDSGVTADMKTKVTLRHYDAVADNVVIPFKLSDSVDEIFTTTGATGTWNLTDKYNGVISVDSSATGTVTLPFAKKYTDMDLTLKNVKENGNSSTKGRTDVLFEFDTNVVDTIWKNVSFGITCTNATDKTCWVQTLGWPKNHIPETRNNGLYKLSAEEAEKYLNGGGVDFRLVRSGKNIYIYIEGKQVAEFDLTQNNSGVTADMEAKVTLRHYDVKSTEIKFPFAVSDTVNKVKLDIASNANGTISANKVSAVKGKAIVSQESTRHFMGETITLTVTPNEGYRCVRLKVNGKIVTLNKGTYTFVATKPKYTVEAIYEAE